MGKRKHADAAESDVGASSSARTGCSVQRWDFSVLQEYRAYVVDWRLEKLAALKVYRRLVEEHGVEVSRRCVEAFVSQQEMPEQVVAADETLVRRSSELEVHKQSIVEAVGGGGDWRTVQQCLRTRHKVVCTSRCITAYLESIGLSGDGGVAGVEDAGGGAGVVEVSCLCCGMD